LTNIKLLVLNLPNSPGRKVNRDYAGGFGTAIPLSTIRRKQSGKPFLNLFLPYSAAVAQEAGCECKVVDAQALKLTKHDILQTVKKYDPSLVISMISLPSLYDDKKTLTEIKQTLPNALTVACGTVCKVIPEEVLNGSNIDLVINDYFPYVNSLHLLLTNLRNPDDVHKLSGTSYKKGNKIFTNAPKPAQKEFTDYKPIYDILPLTEYETITVSDKKCSAIPILGSTGCPFSCPYCPYPIGFGSKAIFKHPKTTVDEIEHLNQMGIKSFGFRNQSFTLNQKWAIDVCKEITDRKLDVSWVCEARVDETTKEILTTMHKSGCRRIHYGVETGDPTIIETAKPGVSLQNTNESFKTAREIGIWRHAHIILGLPGETQKTLETTSKFLLKMDPDSVTLNFATPYPGTKMHEDAKKNNWITTNDWGHYSSFDIVMETPSIRADDLYKAAMQIAKSLAHQKIRQLLATGLSIRKAKSIADHYRQIATTQINYRNRIRNFYKRQRKEQKQEDFQVQS